jgi:hypothetical protein
MKALAESGNKCPNQGVRNPNYSPAPFLLLIAAKYSGNNPLFQPNFYPSLASPIRLRYTWKMAAPFVPSPLDCIGRKRFAFYPPIDNGGPNDWLLGTGSRSEVQAINAQTGAEIWIARQYIGAVSDHTHVLTVGLRKALEFREGVLQPRVKRVIEMPQVSSDRFLLRRDQGPGAVVAIRLEDGRKSSMNKAVVAIAIASLVAALLAAWFSSASTSSAVHF